MHAVRSSREEGGKIHPHGSFQSLPIFNQREVFKAQKEVHLKKNHILKYVPDGFKSNFKKYKRTEKKFVNIWFHSSFLFD